MVQQIKSPLNFIDVFSGAGGLSCGLEMSGMKCLLGIENNKYAIKTFAHNHPTAKTWNDSIHKLSNKKLKQIIEGQTVHAIVGGPPCQGFSTVGLGDPNDKRNSLFLQFLRIVKATNPWFIVIENVTGILAKKNEPVLKSIFKKFVNLGYNLDIQVMFAQQYGVPETRRRTIILGTRVNNSATFPIPTHDTTVTSTFRPAKTVGEVLNSLSTAKGELFNHDLEAAKISSTIDRKRLKRIPEGKGIRYQEDELSYLPPSLRLGVNWNKIPEGRFRQTKYLKLNRNKPSPTIMTHRHSYYHPTELRFLTQREAAKLQSFPNDFVFHGPLSAQWRQIGNAVPPLLGKAIGSSLIKMGKQADKNTICKSIKASLKQSSISIVNNRKKAFVYHT